MVKEEGYAIRTLGLNPNGSVYKDGYDGESFYESAVTVNLIADKDEATAQLRHMKREYDDGTVKFSLHKITRNIVIVTEEVTDIVEDEGDGDIV